MGKEPEISVGILQNETISFTFRSEYSFQGKVFTGEQSASFRHGKIDWNGSGFDELLFTPGTENASFILQDVVIGINFHWERKEDQVFQGSLKLIAENGKIQVINILPVENYLISVISSEMSATASLELLKAHAVISRSWLLAQIEKQQELKEQEMQDTTCGTPSFREDEHEIIRWYDREDHLLFDVCADDHCQRYQGITRASTNLGTIKEAVNGTRGEALLYAGKICDARFYKCCGGVVEEFQNTWENVRHPYLVKLRDDAGASACPDLTVEAEAEKWIRSRPSAFCNTQDKEILSQVLNNYDQETTDFYRWTVTYSQDELSDLARERSGIDFGRIEELVPVERGVSGRLVKLKIIGSKRTMIIGKELEIRRILSKSHLFSSAFIAEKKDGLFTLTGAGWGHGVGLCQIGAAVMGEKGFTYQQILLHYYVGAETKHLY
ncbi:MAG: SpoIID/LytB domain-containing protein [Tannerella sp.]|jgi:SpoIID/LytB domain protein|nr:SpoIID/LytB domain-containing protein [Tannerella sp.]